MQKIKLMHTFGVFNRYIIIPNDVITFSYVALSERKNTRSKMIA